jgi:hypothetical protein
MVSGEEFRRPSGTWQKWGVVSPGASPLATGNRRSATKKLVSASSSTFVLIQYSLTPNRFDPQSEISASHFPLGRA